MDLRNSRHKKEYKDLQTTLNGFGYYEEGMELQEMYQILDALQMSTAEDETSFLNCDMQQVRKEGELNFVTTQDGRVLNSTMMAIHPNVSPCSSPDIPPDIIVVQAEVHHEMNWSPPNERLPSKRVAFGSTVADNDSYTAEYEPKEEPLESYAKRSANANAANETINVENRNNSIENIFEVSSTNLHDTQGSVSELSEHDSGLITSNEHSFSTVNNTSNSSISFSTSSFNKSVTSTPQLVGNSPEIRGPVSLRPIHDSGFHISTEIANTSVANNSISTSSNSLENSMQISTNSASS